jgi:hypothetical protein
MYKAFSGANGWYVAFERNDGFHNQPVSQDLTEKQARLLARSYNDEDMGVTVSGTENYDAPA